MLRAAEKMLHSDWEKLMLLAKSMDAHEAGFHAAYPNDPCPLEGGYVAALRRLFGESHT